MVWNNTNSLASRALGHTPFHCAGIVDSGKNLFLCLLWSLQVTRVSLSLLQSSKPAASPLSLFPWCFPLLLVIPLGPSGWSRVTLFYGFMAKTATVAFNSAPSLPGERMNSRQMETQSCPGGCSSVHHSLDSNLFLILFQANKQLQRTKFYYQRKGHLHIYMISFLFGF